MSGKFEGIKQRSFGIEIEMTGITRCQAAKAVADLFGTEASHDGGYYDKYTVKDDKGRKWSFVFDGSIRGVNSHRESEGGSYNVELNSPVLEYEDIPKLQEVIRALRGAGAVTGPKYRCGTHIHISADDYTPKQLRNLVNIFASKEDFLWDALQVSTTRSSYCHKSDPVFVEKLNKLKPNNMEKIKELWYRMEYKRLYIAYGSNINLEQMKYRCPHSKVVGTKMLPDYELEFRGVATIVPKKGAQVPVLMWEIDQRDELSLDRYEGFPNLYRKEIFEMNVNGKLREGMAYLMNGGEISPPSPMYYKAIQKGYEANGMDTSYLKAALERSVEYQQSKKHDTDLDFDSEEDLDDECEDMDDHEDPCQLALE